MKKGHEEEAENDERWLLTYADLITLLMAFFVIMYAMAKVDTQKYQQLSESLRFAFHTKVKSATISDFGGTGYPGGEGMGATSKNALPMIKEQFEKLIKQKGLQGSISISIDSNTLVIALSDILLFDEGKADIRDDALLLLNPIAEILLTVDNEITVEGHTDNTPIHNARYTSNWQLSTDRATNVIMYLIENHHISPQKLSAAGYGEYRPLMENDTPENKAKNRRVDFVIYAIAEDDVNPKTDTQTNSSHETKPKSHH